MGLEIRRIVLGFEGDGLFVTKTIITVSSPGIGAQLTELSRICHVLPDLVNDLEKDDCTMLEGYSKICDLIKIKNFERERNHTQHLTSFLISNLV